MDQRPKRQAQISALLRAQRVESQEHLQTLLAERGVHVAQATLSRDLKALGVMKGSSGYVLAEDLGGLASLPGEVDGPSENPALQRAVGMFVVRVDVGGSLVVLRTGPGHAQVVALELDRRPPDGLMGTIAGDDTVFLAMKTERRAAMLARELRSMLGGAPDPSRREVMA
ncbi:MAG: arginine repressor [Phycisphaerales bacterium]|nr:arginine repressor [Phycisphaerales bacterium]